MKNLSLFLSRRLLFLLLPLTFALGACSTFSKKTQWDLPPISADEVSVMSFNMENLFDTTHDEDKDDYTFLPRAQKQSVEHKRICAKVLNPFYQNECLNLDWSEEVLQVKLKNLAQVILGVDGHGPDNLMTMEVENIGVLSRLNREFLGPAGYQTVVLIEGPDKRGIDIGFLSRFPLIGKPELHKIPFVAANETEKEHLDDVRGILEVTVKLPDGSPLTMFGVHFPSQAAPHAWREQAAKYLMELIRQKGNQTMAIGMGDLNITHEEEEEFHIFRDVFAKEAQVSHLVGCSNCAGSHNYKKSWSFLDAHIYDGALSPTGKGAYRLEPETIDVIRYDPIHLQKGKYPKRFDPANKTGVSDHFPLYARLKKRAGDVKIVTPTDSSTAATTEVK
jgi:endonuclease/exonuclease/phosphatase family metal-dependent hydrolase